MIQGEPGGQGVGGYAGNSVKDGELELGLRFEGVS